MKLMTFHKWLACMAVGCCLATTTIAQDTVANTLGVIEEKLNRLRADVEALQFTQQKLQQQVDDLKAQVIELRRAGSTTDLQALEARINAVDEARKRDNKVLVDQLAKELARLGGQTGAIAGGGEHVVQKGESLSTIAKQYGVSVDALAKANNLANPNELKIGQKLIIPK